MYATHTLITILEHNYSKSQYLIVTVKIPSHFQYYGWIKYRAKYGFADNGIYSLIGISGNYKSSADRTRRGGAGPFMARQETTNPEAFEKRLKGRDLLRTGNKEDSAQARQLWEEVTTFISRAIPYENWCHRFCIESFPSDLYSIIR